MARKRQAASSAEDIAGSPVSSPVTGVTIDEFDRLMFACTPPCIGAEASLAVGVSGGADSMALCLLAANWAQRFGWHFVALTVDHGLRPRAANEAIQVATWLKERGIVHQTLKTTRAKPKANIQAWARSARYDLMDEWCAEKGVAMLLLAHHLEDQAETFLLRLARGSGVDGLAAMAPAGSPRFDGAPWRVRPVLDIAKARLVATLETTQQAWIDDPTNQDQKYARNRLRANAPNLAAMGLTPARLATTAKAMRRAKKALDADVMQTLEQAVTAHSLGYGEIDIAAFSQATEEVQLRTLARLLSAFSGQAYGPPLSKLEPLLSALLAGDLAGGRTLSGCRIVPVESQVGVVLICRESRSVAGAHALGPGQPVMWDGRFRLKTRGIAGDDPVTVGRLGADGWSAIRKTSDKSLLERVPRIVGLNLPAVWREGVLLSVPLLGYPSEATELVVDIEFFASRQLFPEPVEGF